MNICVVVILFLVSVFVLLEYIILVYLSVFIMGSFLIMVFFLVIFIILSVRVIVIIMGRFFGMVVIVKLVKKNINKIVKNYYLLGFCSN